MVAGSLVASTDLEMTWASAVATSRSRSQDISKPMEIITFWILTALLNRRKLASVQN